MIHLVLADDNEAIQIFIILLKKTKKNLPIYFLNKLINDSSFYIMLYLIISDLKNIIFRYIKPNYFLTIFYKLWMEILNLIEPCYKLPILK